MNFCRVLPVLGYPVYLFRCVSPRQGWGESILSGLRGTAWKEKVASIERITQGVLSGEVGVWVSHRQQSTLLAK